MKKLATVGILLASMAALVGCDGASVVAAQEQRMTYVERTDYGDILCDNRTGVMYFVYDNYQRGGVCVMVDADGKPLVTCESERMDGETVEN